MRSMVTPPKRSITPLDTWGRQETWSGSLQLLHLLRLGSSPGGWPSSQGESACGADLDGGTILRIGVCVCEDV